MGDGPSGVAQLRHSERADEKAQRQPVQAALELAADFIAIVAFRHAADAVPKLSLLSVRHLIQAVRRIDELPLKRSTRYRAILGLARKVPDALATAVAQRPTMAELETDEGPLLVIPTRNIICLTPASGSGKLEASSASSNFLSFSRVIP